MSQLPVEIVFRAERRLGQMLKNTPPQVGAGGRAKAGENEVPKRNLVLPSLPLLPTWASTRLGVLKKNSNYQGCSGGSFLEPPEDQEPESWPMNRRPYLRLTTT